MMRSRTFCTNSLSPVLLRVTTSHFSGVVTRICVRVISAFVKCMSPALLEVIHKLSLTSQLSNFDTEPRESLAQFFDNFRRESFHRGDVDLQVSVGFESLSAYNLEICLLNLVMRCVRRGVR